MNEYVLTSKVFEGQLEFGYDNGVLVKFINKAEMSKEQMLYLVSHFPLYETMLESIVSKVSKLQKIIDITFDRFWSDYGKKVNKKRTEQLWSKLTDADKQVCINKIIAYKNYCKLNNRIQKDPDTYLRNRSWEDELT